MSAAAVERRAAAAARRRREQEEEEMTLMNTDPSGAVEYKIIRSATGAFKDPAKFRAALDEEARAGWELVEKLDNSRARLRRSTECRKGDTGLGQDPYRTQVGISEGRPGHRDCGRSLGRPGAAHRCGGGYGGDAALAEVKTPNQPLKQTAALLPWLRGIPTFEGRPLLNLGVSTHGERPP